MVIKCHKMDFFLLTLSTRLVTKCLIKSSCCYCSELRVQLNVQAVNVKLACRTGSCKYQIHISSIDSYF